MPFSVKDDTPATTVAAADKFLFGDVSADGFDTITAAKLLKTLADNTDDAAGVRTALGVSAGSWGGITGTLSSQTDLQAALDLKANLSILTGRKVQLMSELTGTGTSAGNAATNTSAVNALLAAGYTVVADKGTYPVTQLVIPAAGGCGLMGVDPYGTGFKSANGANATMIICGPADGVGAIYPAAPAVTKGNGVFLKDLYLDFNRANNSTTGDARGGNFTGQQVVYNSVWWLNGIRLHDLNNILIDNCTLVESPTFQVLFNDCTNVVVRGNRSVCAARGYQTPLTNQDCYHFQGGCSDVWVVGNNMQSSDDCVAINLAEGTSRRGKRFYVLNNTVDNSISLARVYGSQNSLNLIPPGSLPESPHVDQVIISGNTGDVYGRAVTIGLESAEGQVVDHTRAVRVENNILDVRGHLVHAFSSAGSVLVKNNTIRPRGPGIVTEAEAALCFVGGRACVGQVSVEGNVIYRDQSPGMDLLRIGGASEGGRVESAIVAGNRVGGPLAEFAVNPAVIYSNPAARQPRPSAVNLIGATALPTFVGRLILENNDMSGYTSFVTGAEGGVDSLILRNNYQRTVTAPSLAARVILSGAFGRVGRLVSDGTTGPTELGAVYTASGGAAVHKAGGDDFLRDGPSLTDAQALPGYPFRAADHGNVPAIRVGAAVSTFDLTAAATVSVPAALYEWTTVYEDTGGTDPAEGGDGAAFWLSAPSGRELTQSTAGSRPTYRAAVSGGRSTWLDFDGGDSLSGSLTSFPAANAARSASAWFKVADGATGNLIFLGYGPASTNQAWILGSFGGQVGFTNFGSSVLAGGFNDGNWHLLHVTHDGTTVKVYVDAVLRASSAFTLNTTLSGSFTVGLGTGYSSSNLTGSLARLKLWNVALTASEVSDDYTSAAVP
jgi:hypothetical protein